MKDKKFNFKNLLVVITVMMMTLCMLATVACSNGNNTQTSSSSSSSQSTSSSVSKTDYQEITNGDFEFGTDAKNVTYPVSSSINWTRSTDSLLNSAETSNKLSGIIDTKDEEYNKISETQNFPKDGENYFNPRTPEYYGLVENTYTYDEDVINEDKLPTSGSKVLMIHNVLTSEAGRGTAQKFTSSKTFGVSAYGKLSVWVLTKDLKTLQDTNEFGAYVSLRTTLSTEVNPLIVKNINTDGKWVKYSFYLKAHDYMETKFRVVLGLGFGSRDVCQEYVEGFAYFDNVTYEDITLTEYEKGLQNATDDGVEAFKAYELGEKNVSKLAKKDNLVYSVTNINKTIEDNKDKKFTQYNFAYDCSIAMNDQDVSSMTAKVNDNFTNADKVENYGKDIVAGVGAFSTISSNEMLKGVENPFGNDAQTAYIIHPTNASSSLTLPSITVENDDVYYLSFYAKISTKYSNQVGVTLSYKDHGSANDTKSELTANVTTNEVEDENYKDFVKFNVFVANKVDDGEQRTFDLVIDFGKTETESVYMNLTTGYAIFTNFKTTSLSQEEYNKATESSYSVMGSLGADKPNGGEKEDNEDTYTFNYSGANKTTIASSPANDIIGYTGVVGNHVMTGGNEESFIQDGTVAGLINTEYLQNYNDLTEEEKQVISTLKATGDNKLVQPIMIKNSNANSYGYLSATKTITAKTSTLVSVQVKALGNAKAYVYLVNADSLSNFEILSLTAKDYTFENDTLTTSDNNKVSENFVQTVTATESADGWVTVNFLVTAGDSDISYRIELWNGSRDASETSEGLVLFDNAVTSNPSVNNFMAKLEADTSTDPRKVEYTRIPTKVNYKDVDGKDAVKYKTYLPTTVYTEYADLKTVIASYETIAVDNEITEETPADTSDSASTSTSDSGSTTTIPQQNASLQIISIIIAVVLVFVLIIALVRMFTKKKKKEKVVTTTYYNRDSRAKAQEQINANKAKREAAAKAKIEADKATETEEAPKEYDYDNMENNIPTDETEEQPNDSEMADGETAESEQPTDEDKPQ